MTVRPTFIALGGTQNMLGSFARCAECFSNLSEQLVQPVADAWSVREVAVPVAEGIWGYIGKHAFRFALDVPSSIEQPIYS
jgi:hypothetical protein